MNIVFEDDGYQVDAAAEIDRIGDAARLRVVGDPVRVKEYETAEAEARAYRDAGYTGTVPPSVASWTYAKRRSNWTDREACDDILGAAVRWTQALQVIRGMRLDAKEAVKFSAGKAEVDSIVGKFQADLAQLMQGVQ